MAGDKVSPRRIRSDEITDVLSEAIRLGVYGAGESFPSLSALMRRFNISRPCAARSVAELKRMGLVETQVGSGTRVKNRTIGVLIPGTADSEFFRALLEGIRDNCQRRGSEMVTCDFSCNHSRRAQETVDFARELVERNVAGVILQPIGFNAEAAEINRTIEKILSDAGIPVVLIDYDVAEPPLRSQHDLIAIDNFNAGRCIAKHLLDAGAKRISCLLRRLSAESVWTRYDGVDSVLKRTYGSCADRIEAEPDDVKAVADGLEQFRPDAIVCSNDIAANNLLKTLKKLKVRVPEDVMLTGFDDVELAGKMMPGLTTIHQPCAELATTAFETLMSRLDNPDLPPREVFLNAPLVVRASTRS